VNLWGAQVEQASAAGPFVSTIGTARASGGQGGTVTFPYSLLLEGTHPITVAYAGDANFVASTSNTLILNFGKATPGIVLSSNPATSSNYGQSVTLTAQLSGSSTDPANIPTGSVQFIDGGVSLGAGTIGTDGSASVTLTALPAGTHPITAVYGGDAEFNSATSTALASQLGATPTGTVTVMDGTTSLGTASPDSTGTGTLTVPLFTAGTHTLTVSYSGDGNYN
jgi:Bacterial Ig-like domain (group 3)